ncbi:GIP [Symbiodinium sp. CCMP2456]|nr:GIP [Symbiodinium sp. CCMP2456]
MADASDRSAVPAWDGSARTWRRYTREVAWWVTSTPAHKRRYCASKLLSRLTGPARLLAMSWSRMALDNESGTRTLLQRLAASPLVRQTLPNTAAICQQYFSFKRNPSESIGNFLVRETLVHEEFVEAIIRLHEEKMGVSQEARDFGLPPVDESSWDTWEDADWTGGSWGWWPDEDYEPEEGPPPVGEPPAAEDVAPDPAAPPGPSSPMAAPGSSPSHRGEPDLPRGGDMPETTKAADGPPEAIDEMSMTDSFILGVLRGWRLLQAAGLSAEEKRDILSTTKNSLDYEVVSAALQSLWDDQLLGHRSHGGHGNYHMNCVDSTHDFSEQYADTNGWEDEWWPEAMYGDHYEEQWDDPHGWWEDEWSSPNTVQAATTEDMTPEDQERMREAQQAERVAETLAVEAQRTWADAQRATQAIRRDRGFGAASTSPGANGTCFQCGGNHFARDCPQRRSFGGKGHGKGFGKCKGAFYISPEELYANFVPKGKGKHKGKRNMWMEAQGLWTKGKSKGKSKSKDPSRSVNAYSTDVFVGGLELREGMDLNSANTVAARPEVGMLDCGATASAGFEAVIQSLVTAVLAQDRGARIEVDQASRPYFRFGNGKWGRALCRVSLQSSISGQTRSFALYMLPNPSEYYQSQFDRSALVPILIGMDFLGPEGVGMMIDFASGLAMQTKETNPEIFKLDVNAKGHYVLDIVQHLTRGHRCDEGHALVIVRGSQSESHSPLSHQMLELWTAWIDLTVSESDMHARDLELARNRMWQLYRAGQASCSSTASSAQMLSRRDSIAPSTSPSRSNPHGLGFVGANGGPRDRADPRGLGKGQISRQGPTTVLGQDPDDEGRPSRSTDPERTVAMFRESCPSTGAEQCPRTVDPLLSLRPPAPLHPPKRVTFNDNGSGQCSNGEQDVKPTAKICHHMMNKITAETVLQKSIQDLLGNPYSTGTTPPMATTNGATMDNDEELVKAYEEVPLYMGKKLMAMASMMTAATTSLLVGLQLDGRDGVWEISSSPHSWLSMSADQHGLQPRTINLANGYDLYDKNTWQCLRELRARHQPQRLWFSLPFSKWCPWNAANYNSPEKRVKLETARRRERRLLWEVNSFVKEALEADPNVLVYVEWPHPSGAWRQHPMVDLATHLEDQGVPWQTCRIDGCAYGMRDSSTGQFIKKPWTVKTNDEQFHRNYRAKVCPGNHGFHQEQITSSEETYYPWKMVQSITRHWCNQLAPQRHLHLLHRRDDLPSLEVEENFNIQVEDNEEMPEEWQDDGVDTEDSNVLVNFVESQRLLVESMAREARLRQDFSMDACETLLLELSQFLGFHQSQRHRWEDGKQLQHVVFGGYSHGGFGGVTKASAKFGEVTRYLNHYFEHHLPQHSWTSIMVTFNGRALPHRDHHNLPNTTNALHCLGNFTGGELWVGQNRPGYRIALSVYTARMLPNFNEETLQQLRSLRFPFKIPSALLVSFPTELVTEEASSPVDPETEVPEAELSRWEAQVAKFHRAAGHPQLSQDHQGGTSSGQVPPASTQGLYAAWEAVGVDSGEWIPPGSKVKVKFLLFMDMATKLRIVKPLFTYDFLQMRAESGDDLIKGLSERWLGIFPKPKILILDSAKSFVSESVHEFANSMNIMLSFVAEKEAWANGIIEAGVQDLKMTASAIHLEAMDQDPFVTLYLSTSALNSTEYVAGYSSFQWAYGKEYNLNDEDVRTLTASEFKGEYSKLVSLRESAEAVAKKTRARRVLSKLGNTTVRQPLRSFHPMQLVKVWRKVWPREQHQGPRGGLKKAGRPHWVGPGRVVFNEVLPHQEAHDDRRHIVWVLVGTQLLRCSAHSVRLLTETERLQFELVNQENPSEWKSLADLLPKREYYDLTDQVPHPDEVEQPDLPRQPDSSTLAPPTRRVSRKTTVTLRDDASEASRATPSTSSANPTGSSPSASSANPTGSSPSASSANPLGSSPVVSQSTDDGLHRPISLVPSVRLPEEAVNDYDESTVKRARHLDNWVEVLHVEAAREAQFDVYHAMEMTEDFLMVSFAVPAPTSNRQRRLLHNNPNAYLVRKMKDAEVVLTRLPASERALFTRAKSKEVDSFLKNEAVRKCLDNEEIRKAYDTQRIVRAHWVLTWKLTPAEDLEEAKQDAQTNPSTVFTSDGSKKAKARIVLLGFEHPNLLDHSFKTSSPVQSTLGRNMLYAMAAHHQWPLEGLDLATAFLQTQATEADQELWTSGVQELRDALGVGSELIMRILRNIYGSTTAPRGLWLDLHKTLTSLGAHPVMGERCLWVWPSKTEKDGDHPKSIGAMGGHVDDFHRIGDDSPEWRAIKDQVNTAYKWGMTKTRAYRHAGTDVETKTDERGNDFIEVNQDYYIEAIPDLDISPDRLRFEGSLDRDDVNACRGALGALQWVATQSQPLLCARCSLLTSELASTPTMEVAREIQSLIGEVRANPTRLVFQRFPDAEHWSDIIFISMGDQAHNNRARGDSTGGLVTLMAGPGCLDGRIAKMSLLSWRTWKLKRKAISSNDAEVQAMLEAEDQNFRTRLIWSELHCAGDHDPGLRQRRDLVSVIERQVLKLRGILCTDSKGGYDAVEVNESPLLGLSNTRAALQAFQLRGNLERAAGNLRWVASDYDLADALTKKRADCRVGLLRFLQTGLWSIKYDPQFQSSKKNKKAGKSAVGDIDEFLGNDGSPEWATASIADLLWGWCNRLGP